MKIHQQEWQNAISVELDRALQQIYMACFRTRCNDELALLPTWLVQLKQKLRENTPKKWANKTPISVLYSKWGKKFVQNITTVPNSVFYLKIRNKMDNTVIEKYAKQHHLTNGGNGMARLFIPQDSIMATLTPMAAQASLICQLLIKELSYIYSVTPEMIAHGLLTDVFTVETTYDLKNKLIIEFGPEFILELLLKIWAESGVGANQQLLPIIGEIVVTTLEATFTATLMWQIGTITAMYFMNDEKWVTSKQETHRRARKQTGLPSPNIRRPGVLKNIPQKNPEIQGKMIRGVGQIIRLMKENNPAITPAQIRSLLKEKGISYEFIKIE